MAEPSKHTDTELLPCPFCAQAMLWRDSENNADPHRPVMESYFWHPGFSNDTNACLLSGQGWAEKRVNHWNTRASPTSDHNPLTVKDMRHSDVVERVARNAADELAFFYGPLNVTTVDEIAKAVAKRCLEAAHHAELVEALDRLTSKAADYLALGGSPDPLRAAIRGAETFLAKIGGDV